jgi:hypothetical protein
MNLTIAQLGNYTVFIHDFDETGEKALMEANHRGTHLVGLYSYNKHQPHNPTGEYHLHVYKKNNEIFSINQSGKGHDGYSGTRIPNDVYGALKDKFPTWNWPATQLIESVNHEHTNTISMKEYLRPVRVITHKLDLNLIEAFDGYFHTFADDPFIGGGNTGHFAKTIALVEDEKGNIKKVAVDSIRFTDREEF